MRYVFRCTPDELRRQKIRDIQEVLACMDIEAKMADINRQLGQQ